MKFFKVIAVVLVVMMLMMTLTACSSSSFLSDSKIAKLVEQYGTPTMDVVIEYTYEDSVTQITLSYELQLETTPITVVNFINLVEAEYYNAVTEDDVTTSHIFGTGFSSTNALLAGKYTQSISTDEDVDDTFSLSETLDYTILGEFVQNGYVLDVADDEEDEDVTDSNNTVELFSLAMYYGSTASTFDDANGQFILTTSSVNTVNYQNFAVFAYLTNMKVVVDDVEVYNGYDVDSTTLEVITEYLTSTTTQDVVYTDEYGVEQETSVSLYSDAIRIVSITMTDDNDYSSLPTYVID